MMTSIVKSILPVQIGAILLGSALSLAAATPPDTFSSFAGAGPDHVPALAANVDYPVSVAVDKAGNFYFTDQYSTEQRVFKVSTSGLLTVVAGNGFAGFQGDGNLATLAELNAPRAVAVDSSDNLYIADQNNCVVRKVTASSGIITTVAGTPNSCAYSGDGGPATSAHLNTPVGVAVDSSGNIYIADYYNQRIRKVATNGTITTVAGDGTAGFSGDGGLATAAELNGPDSVSVDGSKNIYILDAYNYRVRKVNASSGDISTVAGDGTAGYAGDGGAATKASINFSYGLYSDSSGRFFIADTSNCVVRQVTTSGVISTVAGDHSCSYGGDGGLATSAGLSSPYGVTVDTSNHLFIADTFNLLIRKATIGSTINTAAGNRTLSYLGDGDPAEGATVDHPTSATADNSGNIYIADQNNCVVRKVNTSGIISTVAGTPGACGSAGDGSAATSAELSYPAKAVVDNSGNLYVADRNNCKIRKVATNGIITTYAGSGSCGYGGDGGAATAAQLYYPDGLTVDSSGNVYVADTYNQRIRKIATNGIISTVAGNGTAGFGGDGGSATSGELDNPTDVAFDPISGSFYIADQGNYRVRMLRNGSISTFAGNGAGGYQGDGGQATETSLYGPSEVAVDVAGDVIISDYYNNRVRWVSPTGFIHTIAGNGTYGFGGDGALATTGEIANAWGVGVDHAGNIYVADSNNNRVRMIAAIPNVVPSTYNVTFPEQQINTTSDPQSLILRAVGPATVTGLSPSSPFTEADDCPSTLASDTYCNVDAYFTPTKPGSQSGNLNVSTNSFFGGTVTVALSGTGGGLLFVPESANFGTVKVGTKSAAKSITFTNYSSSSLSFSSVATTRSQFAVTSNTCKGTVAGGKSCTISLTFTPTATGALTGSLVVKDSDPSSPQLIPLSGTGN
jgi:sugar lactone lactonase YvrE